MIGFFLTLYLHKKIEKVFFFRNLLLNQNRKEKMSDTEIL